MITLTGNFCKDCKIFTDNIETGALALVQSILDHPAFQDAQVRIMPDVHAGKGITIGFSAPLGTYVNPNHVGVDIGCTVSCMELSAPIPESGYGKFEHRVAETIPTGFHIWDKEVIDRQELFDFLHQEYQRVMQDFPKMVHPIDTLDETFITRFLQRIGMNAETFYRSLPSLGGGNHFLEYGETVDGKAFFTAHCGSRNLGVKVCNYWVRQGKVTNPPLYDQKLRETIEAVKRHCPDRTQWHRLIEEAKQQRHEEERIREYLCGEALKGYLSDMVLTQAYAQFNHQMIHRYVGQILEELFGIHPVDLIVSTHNYIDFRDHPMLRKGAIRAYDQERCIIPFNMRDGLAICRGKSNPDWNYTAPHGAGRLLSRTEAKKQLRLEEFQDTMSGVYSTTICPGTLDESPMAYKPMDEIVRLIEPTVEILYFVRPRINIKATEPEA